MIAWIRIIFCSFTQIYIYLVFSRFLFHKIYAIAEPVVVNMYTNKVWYVAISYYHPELPEGLMDEFWVAALSFPILK